MLRFCVSVLVLSSMAVPALAQDRAQTAATTTKLSLLPKDRREGWNAVSLAECREWLTYLASDELEGRETGTRGFKKAAEFVAAKFKEFGLKPVGDNGTYFQNVPFVGTRVAPEKSWIALMAGDNEVLRLAVGKGVGGSISEKSSASAPVVFVVAQSPDDIDRQALGGKAVILVDRSKRTRWGMSQALMSVYRARTAAVFTVDDALAKRPVAARQRISYAGGGSGQRRWFRRQNRYALTQAAASSILKAAKVDYDWSAKGAAMHVLDGFEIKTEIVVETKPVFAANVVGFLEGGDPKLKGQIVGIGSHLDHIGINAAGQINNGADDDGSGTTGVLALAKAFTRNPVRTRRSILFMTFCGEEKGLIGSGYYVDHPIFPNENMIAELQMDMIGRNEEKRGERAEDNVNSLHLVGTKKLSDELHRLCLDANGKYVGFDYEWDEEGVFTRSDHAKFAAKNIPIAFFFTGFHPQYHRPDDTVDRINFPKLYRVAKLVYDIGFELAERDHPPKVVRTFEQAVGGGNRRRRR